MLTLEDIIARFKAAADPPNVEGMSRYGIRPKKAYGISSPVLRAMAKEIGKNHSLALQLWKEGSLEAKGLASLIAEPARITKKQMNEWVKDLECWADCDAVAYGLFDRTKYAWEMPAVWSRRGAEHVKRAAFSLMAGLAVHNKKATDEQFLPFFPILERESVDERNDVKKAVNWALRQIGKRNAKLNKLAVDSARRIHEIDSRSARWIASDALRELIGEKVQKRIAK